MSKCDRCRIPSLFRYYCEFCQRDFCSLCTKSEAHENNRNGTNLSRGCDFIHKDLNETKTDEVICSNPASPDDENCLCGLGPGHETVQCPECRKRLCKKCPMYPIGDHPECLECIFSMF